MIAHHAIILGHIGNAQSRRRIRHPLAQNKGQGDRQEQHRQRIDRIHKEQQSPV